MQHLKRIYLRRRGGIAVSIKNARGKGAAHVVDFAIRQSRNAAYDVKAVLLDTDTDWNDKTRAHAKGAGVLVLPCKPCLEAVLLAVHRVSTEFWTTAQLKQQFVARFGSMASDAAVHERHFDRVVLEEARTRVAVVGNLVSLMTDTSV